MPPTMITGTAMQLSLGRRPLPPDDRRAKGERGGKHTFDRVAKSFVNASDRNLAAFLSTGIRTRFSPSMKATMRWTEVSSRPEAYSRNVDNIFLCRSDDFTARPQS
jgi:hypothetical protein